MSAPTLQADMLAARRKLAAQTSAAAKAAAAAAPTATHPRCLIAQADVRARRATAAAGPHTAVRFADQVRATTLHGAMLRAGQ